MRVEGAAFAIVGALDAFPRRIASRAIASRGGILQRSLSRKTSVAVIGHRLAALGRADAIARRIEQARRAGAQLVSEAGFLQMLGVTSVADMPRQISARQLSDQSGLDAETIELLTLFDAFEFPEEPFGFRDMVAAKQYARLISEGLDWLGIVRAIRAGRAGQGGSFATLRLERSQWNDVLVRDGAAVTELSGQHLLALPDDELPCADALFDEAQEAEEQEDWARARTLYQKAHSIEPADPVIAFNLSHVLLKLGDRQEARRYLTKVLALDANYAEAWYNLAGIAREQGDLEAARRHLSKAVAADPTYADPLYNLALLEFDSGAYAEAARLWEKYRELDPDSDWGRRAKQGLQLIGMIESNPGYRVDRKTADQLHAAR